VTRIKHTKLSDTGAADEGVDVGDRIQILSVRVTNGTNSRIQVDGATAQMTYGPDGEAASLVYQSGIESMSGNLLPGKAKTGTYGFAVPTKYLSDVTMEFSTDFEHEDAIFVGSIK
jgi:hypothetical protein